MTRAEGILLRDGTLMLSDAGGTIAPTESISGLFVDDIRLLSALTLRIGAHPLQAASIETEVSSRRVVSTPVAGRNETVPFVATVDQQVSRTGLRVEVSVTNLSQDPLDLPVSTRLESDFADPFTLRSDKRTFSREGGRIEIILEPAGLRARYDRAVDERRFEAELLLSATGGAEITAAVAEDGIHLAVDLAWQVRVAPGETVTVSMLAGNGQHGSAGLADRPVGRRAPGAVGSRALDDLGALEMPAPGHPEFRIVAAGAPWFLTLFGRDSLITLLLAEDATRHLAPGILRTLALTQGSSTDRRRNEQPGKIVHELRNSELAVLDEVPYGRYYGSVDSTPLFLIALARLGDEALQRDLEEAARSAVRWMRTDGGLDHGRFLRYMPDPSGLLHQGWKDSFDAVAHEDGRLAEGPIALVEVQGYAWLALIETARIARQVWHDTGWAQELEALARQLRLDFREAFWSPELDFPALALDGDDRRVDVVSSNAGHLLFTEILDERDAARVCARLVEPDMFTGFGIRTLSSGQAAYHPLSYHNGSVWPHDTMLVAAGMAAHGHAVEACRVARGVLDALSAFDGRLPELFGGFDRERFSSPVSYPFAAAPQAWAAAAAVAAVALGSPPVA